MYTPLRFLKAWIPRIKYRERDLSALSSGHGECNKAPVCSVKLQSAQWLHGEPIFFTREGLRINIKSMYISFFSSFTPRKQTVGGWGFMCRRFISDLRKGICSAEMCQIENLIIPNTQLQWPLMIKEVKTFRLWVFHQMTQASAPVFMLLSSAQSALRIPTNLPPHVYEPSLNTS